MTRMLLILVMLVCTGCKVSLVFSVHKDWNVYDGYPLQSSAELRMDDILGKK